MLGKTVMSNPGWRVLTGEKQGIVVAPAQTHFTLVYSGTVKLDAQQV